MMTEIHSHGTNLYLEQKITSKLSVWHKNIVPAWTNIDKVQALGLIPKLEGLSHQSCFFPSTNFFVEGIENPPPQGRKVGFF